MKKGDKVISKNNPLLKGVITKVDNSYYYPILVVWDNDSQGVYKTEELSILEDKKEDSKPAHYKTDSFDVIDFCTAYKLNFNRGNVVKYVARAGKKDSEIDDLLKAKDYICREIEIIKNKTK